MNFLVFIFPLKGILTADSGKRMSAYSGGNMMSDMNTRFFRGMVVGVMAGAAMGAAFMPKRKKASKRYVGKALRATGEVLDQISDVLGM